MVKIAWS